MPWISRRPTTALLIALAAALLVAAVPAPASGTGAAFHPPPAAYGYTYHQPDGNRYVTGAGSLPDAVAVDVALDGRPAWVVAAPQSEHASIWAVVLEDGRVQAFRVIGRNVMPVDITPQQVPATMPPVLAVADESYALLVPPKGADASPLTHPVYVMNDWESVTLALITRDGALELYRNELPAARLAANALPDARIVSDGAGGLLFYTRPTDAYDHGVLGDALEPRGIVQLDLTAQTLDTREQMLDGDTVFEGIAPIWADADGDGTRDIITTRSDRTQGARLAVNGIEGPAIGRGYRWRHQIAVAPFGPGRELEIADVLTPHIGGTVEFFRFDGDTLSLVASLGGYTSHSIGSRNLDMAAAGDFNGDGQPELLLPTQDARALAGVQRTAGGAAEVYRVPLDGTLTTNLGAVTLHGGTILTGVGRADGTLRLWIPAQTE